MLLALGAASLVAAAALITGKSVPVDAAVVAFASTFATYNFDRMADRSQDEGVSTPQRHGVVQRQRRPLAVAVVLAALVVAVIALWNAGLHTLWILAFPLSGLLYVTPIFGRRLKDIPYLKSVYVPACWCIFIGDAVVLGDLPVNASLWIFVAFVFARTFVSGALGDIRDLEPDASAGVRTFAGKLGRARSIQVLDAWQIATVLSMCAAAVCRAIPSGALVLLAPACLGYVFFRRFVDGRGDPELTLELYDLEMVMYAPALWLAL